MLHFSVTFSLHGKLLNMSFFYNCTNDMNIS